MSRAAPAAACTGSPSDWPWRSIACSAAGGRWWAIGITPARSRRRGRRARAWSTCCSTSGSTCVRPRASTHGAPGPTFRGGSVDRRQRSSRRPRPRRPPGWPAPAGGALAGRCGWKNGRPQIRDRTPLDSADVVAATRGPRPALESPRDRQDVTNCERRKLDEDGLDRTSLQYLSSGFGLDRDRLFCERIDPLALLRGRLPDHDEPGQPREDEDALLLELPVPHGGQRFQNTGHVLSCEARAVLARDRLDDLGFRQNLRHVDGSPCWTEGASPGVARKLAPQRAGDPLPLPSHVLPGVLRIALPSRRHRPEMHVKDYC